MQQNSLDFLADKSNNVHYNNYSNIISDDLYPFDKDNKFSLFNNNKYNFNSEKQESELMLNSPSSNNEAEKKSNNQNLIKEIIHKEKTIFCQICKIYFTRRSHLKKHCFFKHSGYTGTTCFYCGKNIKQIKDHIRYCRLKFNNKNTFFNKKFKKDILHKH